MKRRLSCTAHKVLLTALLVVALTGASLAQTKDIIAHKALYDVQLHSKNSGAQIVNIDGKMFYEWHRSCDAWESNHRFNLLYEYTDSPSMQITSDLSTYEPFDGRSLNFSSRRMRNGELFEEIRGHAQIKPGEAGEATYTMPEDKTYSLPAGTLFPMGHTKDVMQMMEKGENFHLATIFDGSDEDGPREVTAFIGKKVRPDSAVLANPNVDETLLDNEAHQLRLAFFSLKDSQPSTEYEMDLVFHDNGIISSMIIEYKDFSVAQKLIALEKVEDQCADDAAQTKE